MPNDTNTLSPKCRVCGCTDITACAADDGPCYWLEDSLCSACREAQPHVVRRDNIRGVHSATCRCGWQRQAADSATLSDLVRRHWQDVVADHRRPAPAETAGALVPLDSVQRALASIETPGEAKDVADKAAALRHYATRIQDRSLYFQAAEMELRAMRALGGMLVEIKAAGGLVAGGRGTGGVKLQVETSPPAGPNLEELGIDKNLSKRAQDLWRVPEEQFEHRLPEAIGQAVDRASRGLNYLFRAVAKPAGPATPPPLPAGRYGAILADPPWRFEAYGAAGVDRAPDMHYATMTTPEICALPVAELAAEDSVLFLWVYSPMLPDALKVIGLWGFEYKTLGFNWLKRGEDQAQAPMGGGYWTRHQSEICVLATRGRPQRLHADVRQVIEAPRGRHSAKPDEQYARIERLVAGPYLELFARTARPGWDSWGAEAPGEEMAHG